jgi:RNA polymerase sigma-70 factor (ECF subfamily)
VSGNEVQNLERERLASALIAHLDHLYRVAIYLAKNESEAQDCVQETCARALNSYRQFSVGTNLKAWLTRILYNFYFDSLARNKRTVSAAELSEDAAQKRAYWETVATDEPGPEKRVLQQELSAKINQALKKIPVEFRAPIVLVDMGEFSYQEAADILTCPIGTVRSRLSRGRKLLQGLIGEYLA